MIPIRPDQGPAPIDSSFSSKVDFEQIQEPNIPLAEPKTEAKTSETSKDQLLSNINKTLNNPEVAKLVSPKVFQDVFGVNIGTEKKHAIEERVSSLFNKKVGEQVVLQKAATSGTEALDLAIMSQFMNRESR